MTTAQTSHSPPPRLLDPKILELLLKRGHTEQDIQNLLSWDLKALGEITNLKDMPRAVARIITAVQEGQSIGIYGDYDVDGTTACALFFHFFKLLNVSVTIFQPNRFKDGYGLHISSIDKAKESGVALLITVDCGITNGEAALYAKEQGIDLIITDHHTDALPSLPEAYAVINPNRRDEEKDFPLRVLSGVGVAFAVCVAVKKTWEEQGPQFVIPSLYQLLPWVAIGSLCDMVPLTPLNLKLVRHGMKQMRNGLYPGIKTFYASDRDKEIPVTKLDYEKITFQIGPMINSKGRLECPKESLLLLTSSDSNMANTYYWTLHETNEERKKLQKQVVKEAIAQIEADEEALKAPIHIVYSPRWHEGVVGIVASKIVERFSKPAIVFTDAEESGLIKGSARSFGSLNLFDVLKSAEDLYKKFGGHRAAAGLTLKKENLSLLKKRLAEVIVRDYPRHTWDVGGRVELELSIADVSVDLLRSLEALEPFGPMNPKPHFRLHPVHLESYQIMKEEHIRWQFVDPYAPRHQLKGITFGYLGTGGGLHPDEIMSRCKREELIVEFTLQSNYWRGKEYLQAQVQKIGFQLQ